MSALSRLTGTEARLFLREPVGAFFALAFPAVLVVVLGNAIPAFSEPSADFDGERPINLYLPVVLALAIGTVTMTSLLGVLAQYRERGVLRRLATTPVKPSALIGAQLGVNVAALLVGSALMMIAAVIAFGSRGPDNRPALLVAFLLGAAAMTGVALLIAAVAPNARASAGIGTLVYFPMLFFAGVWTPGPMMPDTAQRIADFTPLGAASQAMQAAWSGDWPQPLHLAVTAAYALITCALATRLFRWQ
ncbi:transport permease protein [Catellatospora sp. IY07-71]|uniref:ABC transporter permease n=1 Tax=Catellatospora sp. IY07-71 TaxID=2728827 RepID=UPI001BB2FAB9|nr:ABC transporter permease [Catellatospora sp. IY07-71]BCJ74641.1 transport permease protein [Catellatospora sp. IY07-71]